ncbi:MAG TPA: hypothetical protein VIJ47_06600 [Acidimicrobiales bacterium]
MSGDTLPDEDLALSARTVLEAHWRPPGFTVPNAATYPWQWLWDSCFHAVCWARFGRADRAVLELTAALAHQGPDGFVPHLTYWDGDARHAAFWGRSETSSLTQPPMYGHAVAELVRRGVTVPDDLVERCRRGLRHLLTARRRASGGLAIVHPWESGCDDSPRWDGWTAPDPWSSPTWKARKGTLVEALRFDAATATPVGSDRFEVASVGFNALVAFNAAELADVIGDPDLAAGADDLARWLAGRWQPDVATWVDEVVVGPSDSARVRTLDALLPLLVCGDPVALSAAFAQLRDPAAFAAPYGPAGVHRHEPTFDPAAYWRGPAWPQLTYLLWVAARRRGRADDASWLAARLQAGARRSALAEYWHPDSGAGLGAVPQSWSALAAVLET